MTYTDYKEDIMLVPDQITATGASIWIMVDFFKNLYPIPSYISPEVTAEFIVILVPPPHVITPSPCPLPLHVNFQIEACLEYSAAGGKIRQLRPPLTWHIHIQTRQAEFHIYTEYPRHKISPLTSSWSQWVYNVLLNCTNCVGIQTYQLHRIKNRRLAYNNVVRSGHTYITRTSSITLVMKLHYIIQAGSIIGLYKAGSDCSCA